MRHSTKFSIVSMLFTISFSLKGYASPTDKPCAYTDSNCIGYNILSWEWLSKRYPEYTTAMTPQFCKSWYPIRSTSIAVPWNVSHYDLTWILATPPGPKEQPVYVDELVVGARFTDGLSPTPIKLYVDGSLFDSRVYGKSRFSDLEFVSFDLPRATPIKSLAIEGRAEVFWYKARRMATADLEPQQVTLTFESENEESDFNKIFDNFRGCENYSVESIVMYISHFSIFDKWIKLYMGDQLVTWYRPLNSDGTASGKLQLNAPTPLPLSTNMRVRADGHFDYTVRVNLIRTAP